MARQGYCGIGMNWVREAISDEKGQVDMAYVSIGILTVTAVAALIFICSMSAISYSKCMPTITLETGSEDKRHIVPCVFDPLPVGQAAGLVFGAFAALIGSLAGYMAATRRRDKVQP